jgi:hypothetical protein
MRRRTAITACSTAVFVFFNMKFQRHRHLIDALPAARVADCLVLPSLVARHWLSTTYQPGMRRLIEHDASTARNSSIDYGDGTATLRDVSVVTCVEVKVAI